MTLAASTRSTTYSPTVLTSDFLVGFPIFSDDDLSVLVDGAATTLYSVTSSYSNGRSTDAEITLNTAVTGVDVEIIGSRTPRRDNDYLGGSPDLAGNLQADMDQITAVQQEQARLFDQVPNLSEIQGAVTAAETATTQAAAAVAAAASIDTALLTELGTNAARRDTVNTFALAQTFTAAPVFGDKPQTRAALDLPLSTDADFSVASASVTTRAAIKTFVESTKSGWDYTSAEQAITVNSTITLAHGLTGTPTKFAFKLVCKVVDQDWAIGDEVFLGGPDDVGSLIRGPIAFTESGDATNFYVMVGGGFTLPNKTTFARVGITNSSWRIVAFASL